MPAKEARHYLANQINNGAGMLPGDWDDIDAYEAAIDAQYGDQKLAKYYKAVSSKKDASGAYLFGGTENYGADGNVYVFLTRGSSDFTSYTQQAHQQKVSWYSLSSPHEWFAEQYAHYYRLGKTGEGLEAGTKAKLDELDNQTPADNAPAPAGPAGPDDDGESRLPFPW